MKRSHLLRKSKNNESNIEALTFKSMRQLETSYIEEKSNKISNYRIRGSLYFGPEQLGEAMDELCRRSKHNLKFLRTEGSNCTYVCSAISKKPSKSRKISDSPDDDGESSFEKGHFRRKIKRTNEDSCHFRLKFTYDETTTTYTLCPSSDVLHNHPPEKCSLENWESKTRNIKFSLKEVNLIIRRVFAELSESFGIVDTFFINALKKELLHMQSRKGDSFMSNYKKKVLKLINLVVQKLLSLSKEKMNEFVSSDSLKAIYMIELGANYLSFESLQNIRSLSKGFEEEFN